MAGSTASAHTRLVKAIRRADTRAKTEPHRGKRAPTETGLLDTTSPYPRSFEPAEEGRDSVPYLHVEITTQHEAVAERPEQRTERRLRVVKTVSRKIGVGTGPEGSLPTEVAACKAVDPDAELEQSTERVLKVIESLTEPNEPKMRPSRLRWLGVVLSKPEVGASLVIGTWLRKDFCVTSPVTKVVKRETGVLVETATKSRYFVEHAGDTYSVRSA